MKFYLITLITNYSKNDLANSQPMLNTLIFFFFFKYWSNPGLFLFIEFRYISHMCNRCALTYRYLPHIYELMKEYRGIVSSFNEDFASKKPCRHRDSNPRPFDSRCLDSAASLLYDRNDHLLTQPKFGPSQVASTLEDRLEAVAGKLI